MEAIILPDEEFKKFISKLEKIEEFVENSQNVSLENQWLDNDEVCEILKISKRTLQSYRDRGILPYSQIGNKIYYKASDIQEHLENNYINLKK